MNDPNPGPPALTARAGQQQEEEISNDRANPNRTLHRAAAMSILDQIPDGHALATYNSERARGLVHTDQWTQRMALAQAAFDAARRDAINAEARRTGSTVVELPGSGVILIPESRAQRRWWNWGQR